LFVLFSFLLPPSPPIPSLFPYTTLFRSTPRDGESAAIRRERIAACARQSCREHSESTAPFDVAEDRALGDIETPRVRESCSDAEDRKSTRLNSSHVKISYAVFCLKKKIS